MTKDSNRNRIMITKSDVSGWTINLMDYCDSCYFCWNNIVNERYHKDYIGDFFVKTNLKELENQIKNKVKNGLKRGESTQFYELDNWDIQLSAKCEFWHRNAMNTLVDYDHGNGNENLPVPIHVLKILNRYPEIGNRIRILSKQDYREYINYIPEDALVGVTITTLSDEESKLIQPNAEIPEILEDVLDALNEKGFRTWLVIEPWFSGMNIIRLLQQHKYLDYVWIGKLNHVSSFERSDNHEEVIYPVPSIEEQIEEIKKVFVWKKNNAPDMCIRLKKELINEFEKREIPIPS